MREKGDQRDEWIIFLARNIFPVTFAAHIAK